MKTETYIKPTNTKLTKKQLIAIIDRHFDIQGDCLDVLYEKMHDKTLSDEVRSKCSFAFNIVNDLYFDLYATKTRGIDDK